MVCNRELREGVTIERMSTAIADLETIRKMRKSEARSVHPSRGMHGGDLVTAPPRWEPRLLFGSFHLAVIREFRWRRKQAGHPGCGEDSDEKECHSLHCRCFCYRGYLWSRREAPSIQDTGAEVAFATPDESESEPPREIEIPARDSVLTPASAPCAYSAPTRNQSTGQAKAPAPATHYALRTEEVSIARSALAKGSSNLRKTPIS